MTRLNIQEAKTQEEILACHPVVVELRPHLQEVEKYLQQVIRQQTEGYHLMFIAEGKEVKAILGFRCQEFLARGKNLYIDDVATHSTARGCGYAGALLDWAIEHAKQQSCDTIHLDSGYTRLDAHRLYLNKKFQLSAHHFSRKV
ncbi:MAG: acetyltransferase [Gammaproteobacteria bacterium]|jgi:GNAT superfamily N-acetyltransferase|nr:acetyltransferase [Gammaproteobacteria bacterium]